MDAPVQTATHAAVIQRKRFCRRIEHAHRPPDADLPAAQTASAPVPAAPPPLKQSSTLYGPDVLRRVRHNIAVDPWAANVRDEIVAAAAPWMDKSDDELWSLMFGPGITRSWMVWSNGVCPSCGKNVPMYTWKIDALNRPWKVQCPHCNEFFPKNDFAAYYRSGLDEHGLFIAARADRRRCARPREATPCKIT